MFLTPELDTVTAAALLDGFHGSGLAEIRQAAGCSRVLREDPVYLPFRF